MSLSFATVIALLVLACSSTLRAEFWNYRFTNWHTESGLVSDKIMALTQTRDGYIWIASYEGLARYDGSRFVRFNTDNTPSLGDNNFVAFFEAKDGSLWIGHSSGAITIYRDGRFETKQPQVFRQGEPLTALGLDEKGEAWILQRDGLLVRFRDGLTLMAPAEKGVSLRQLANATDGRLWVSSSSYLAVLRGEHLEEVPLPRAPVGYLEGICASDDGGIWGLLDDQLWKWGGGVWRRDGRSAPKHGAPVQSFIQMKDGTLIAGTSDHGLYIMPVEGAGEAMVLSRDSHFSSDWIPSLAEDHEGGLWIGTGGAGLVHARRVSISTLNPPDGWQGRSTFSVISSRDSSLWVGTEGAGIYRYHDGLWESFAKQAGLRNPYDCSLLETPEGRIVAGTWGAGLWVGDAQGFKRMPGMDTLPIPTAAVCLARDGGLWAGSSLGLFHYRDGEIRWIETGPENLVRDIRAVLEDNQGAVWVGSNGDGIGVLREGVMHRYGKADGLSDVFVRSMYKDRSGVLWVGTAGGGLNRFKDGKFTTIGLRQGLPCSMISSIIETEDGTFWLGSQAGVLRVLRRDLEDCADGRQATVSCKVYGLGDGMPSLMCSSVGQPTACRLEDGRLAFATSRGIAVLDPQSQLKNSFAPPVHLEGMQLDDVFFSAQDLAAGPIVVPPGNHRLRFLFTGLSFADPDMVRFRLKLSGYDKDWRVVGAMRSVEYNYLPAGNYDFQVTACNNDGVWNVAGASVAFRVLPFFWQTGWFLVLSVLFLVILTGLLVWLELRRRMNRRLAEFEQQRLVEQERTRIAKDMHDDMGSQLTKITMLSETARTDLIKYSKTHDGLTQIYDTARGLTRTMDEIVWAVNPRHDTMESLVSYLEKFSLDLLGSAGISCRFDFPLELPAWRLGTEARHSLFLAFKEALHNVMKHSRASQVEISLELAETECRLRLHDNGCGFDINSGAQAVSVDRHAPGNGLGNMHVRLERLGGACEVRSQPGQGTQVSFVLPRKPLRSVVS